MELELSLACLKRGLEVRPRNLDFIKILFWKDFKRAPTTLPAWQPHNTQKHEGQVWAHVEIKSCKKALPKEIADGRLSPVVGKCALFATCVHTCCPSLTRFLPNLRVRQKQRRQANRVPSGHFLRQKPPPHGVLHFDFGNIPNISVSCNSPRKLKKHREITNVVSSAENMVSEGAQKCETKSWNYDKGPRMIKNLRLRTKFLNRWF